MKTLKEKTLDGFFWNFVNNIAVQGLTFVIGIILARLLSPREFGLIGMITVFIAISEIFVKSGFSQALIRKQNCSQADYSTIFYFNFVVGLLFYIIIFFSAPAISNFYKETELTNLLRVLGLVIIIDSLTLIQFTILTKNINFKLNAKISVIAAIISGVIGVSLAFFGFGVWSLVAKTLVYRGTNSLLLWLWNRWKPSLIFSVSSFKELFSFGQKLLLSGLINTIYRNLYYLVIGKFFSAEDLGYFTRASKFKDLPSTNINQVIGIVSYPVLSQIQDNTERLKLGYKKLIKSTMLITFVLMLGMAAVAEPMVISLIGEKWRPSIVFLQVLCFVGMMYPLHSLNLNMLKVSGRPDLLLKLEIYKKLLAIPVVTIGVIFGMKVLFIGMIINTIVGYYLNSFWSGKLIKYPMKEQLLDIFPVLLIAIINAGLVYIIGLLLPFGNIAKLFIQVIIGGVFVISICELIKQEEYVEIKKLVFIRIKALKHARF